MGFTLALEKQKLLTVRQIISGNAACSFQGGLWLAESLFHLKEAIQTLSIAVLPDFKHSSLSKLELKSYVWFTATTTPIKQGKSTGERRMISHSGCLEAWWRGCACHSLPRLSRHNTTWHGHPNKSTRQLFTLEKNVKYYMSAYYMLSSYCATA